MENRERICRLCLQKCNKNFKNIERNAKEAVEILLPKINLAVSDAPVICANCAKTLEKCFDFKWTCLCRHRSKVSNVNKKDNMKRNLKYLHLIKEENDNTNGVQDHTACGLCTKPTNSCSIVSLDTEEEKIILNETFPELDLRNTKICIPCHESLVNCFHFITICSTVEEKIQKHGGNSGINDDEELEPILCEDEANCSDAHSNEILVKMVNQKCYAIEQFRLEDISRCLEEDKTADAIKQEGKFFEKTENDIKHKSENYVKRENQDFNSEGQFTQENWLTLEEESDKLDIVKMEEIFLEEEEKEVEYESENCIDMEEQQSKYLEELNQTEIIKPEEGREAAKYMVKLKLENNLETQNQKFKSFSLFTSSNVSKGEEDCTKFVSKIEEIYFEKEESENKYLGTMEEQKYDLNEEVDIKPDLQYSDRSEDDVAVPYLEEDPSKPCTNYMSVHITDSEIKNKKDVIEHKDPSEVTLYNCDSCSFQAKQKTYLRKHLLVHKSSSEVTLYNCDYCSFRTKRKRCLKQHFLIHKDPSEVTMYNCDFCSFQTRRKGNLKHHILVHKGPMEVTMYNCDFCSFQTKHKRYLKRHLLTHQGSSEVTMFKCDSCSFETRDKYYLRKHVLIAGHKDPLSVTLYNCNYCSFQTKHKGNLKIHLLIHKDPSELPVYSCDFCSFQTRSKYSIKNHLLLVARSNSTEATSYNCDYCSFQTKYKCHLKDHWLTHKDPSEINNYKCEFCSYQTKQKYNITRHLLVHKDSSEVPMYKCVSCSYQAKNKYYLKRHTCPKILQK